MMPRQMHSRLAFGGWNLFTRVTHRFARCPHDARLLGAYSRRYCFEAPPRLISPHTACHAPWRLPGC